MNDPDRVAWELFTYINKTASENRLVNWQTWASAEFIYRDPCATPTWPDKPQNQQGRSSRLLAALNHFMGGQSPFNSDNSEQTFLNRVAFNYVLDNQIWYSEGVVKKAAGDGIDFPEGSLIVKASWRPIEEDQKSQYYWQIMKQGQDGDPHLVGLDGFHLVSKVLPNWFWSTFEHKDNLGRCDAIGCRDSFGCTPQVIPPHKQQDQPYPPGQLTQPLLEMFAKAQLGDIWQNYRLKGTMVTFTDASGRPNLLGSSVLEPNFEAQSSCMTCHTRASTSNNTTGMSTGLGIVSSITPLGGHIGAPDPNWFFSNSTPPATSAPVVYRTDFLWELAGLDSREDCGDGETGTQ